MAWCSAMSARPPGPSTPSSPTLLRLARSRSGGVWVHGRRRRRARSWSRICAALGGFPPCGPLPISASLGYPSSACPPGCTPGCGGRAARRIEVPRRPACSRLACARMPGPGELAAFERSGAASLAVSDPLVSPVGSPGLCSVTLSLPRARTDSLGFSCRGRVSSGAMCPRPSARPCSASVRSSACPPHHARL